MPTVEQLRADYAKEVHAVAKRANIMVGSVSTLWPLCAMTAFIDACVRLEDEKKLVRKLQRSINRGKPT